MKIISNLTIVFFLLVSLGYTVTGAELNTASAGSPPMGGIHPKIMILVDENYMDMKDMAMAITQTELSALFSAKGYTLVDQEQLKQIQAQEETKLALEGNIEAAQRVALRFGAQYVVVGKSLVQDVGEALPGSGLRSLNANMQLKIIQTQSGLLLGSVVKNSVAAHISPATGAAIALKKAASEAFTDYLYGTINKSFASYVNNGRPIKLQINGVGSFKIYKGVVGAIEGVDGISSSRKDSWNKSGGDLNLMVNFRGNGEALAFKLDGIILPGELLLEVVDLSADSVTCNLKEK